VTLKSGHSFKLQLFYISSDFKQVFDPTYGNCYTFNWKREANVTAHRAGANYGYFHFILALNMIFRIESNVICECVRIFGYIGGSWISDNGA
jgi:hypothetical protein